MATCPNTNSPEWKSLVEEVGEKEAYRDFYENNETIRTPEEVLDKIFERESQLESEAIHNKAVREQMESDGTFLVYSEAERLMNPDASMDNLLESVTETSNIDAIKFNQFLSKKLGIENEFITPEQAFEMTKNSINPWSGQKSFFFNGKVHFVGKNMSVTDVFHEYSHPIVSAIRNENAALFDSLFEQLGKTLRGKEIIEDVYKNYEDISSAPEYVKEEAIVRGLEEVFNNKEQEVGFKSFINVLMFQIKRFLRRAFGSKIDISKLTPSTTIQEITTMIEKGSDFKFDRAGVTQEDIVQYKNDIDKMFEEIKVAGDTDIQRLTNIMFETRRISEEKIKNPEDIDFSTALAVYNALGKGTPQDLMTNLSKYQDAIFRDRRQILNDGINSWDQAMTSIKSMAQASKLVEDMLQNLVGLQESKDISGQDLVGRAEYINRFLKPYKTMADSAMEVAEDIFGKGAKNEVTKTLSDIKSNLDRVDNIISEIFNEGLSTVFYSQLEHSANKIKSYYEDFIANLEKNNASEKLIDRYYKEYYGMKKSEWQRFSELDNKQKLYGREKIEHEQLEKKYMLGMMLSEKKISKLLQGELKDANWFNGHLEGYLYSTDPSVSAFANFVRDQYIVMEAKMYEKMHDFYNDVFGDLKAIGYDPKKIGRLAKQHLLLRDKVYLKNYKTGEFEETVVYSFHDKTKNARADRTRLEIAKKDAFNEWVDRGKPKSGEYYNNMIEALNEYQNHIDDYWNQGYTKEYIDFKNSFFRHREGGVIAEESLNSINERIRQINSYMDSAIDPLSYKAELDLLKQERRELYSEYKNGIKKTGTDLTTAKILREYRDASREFYEDSVYNDGSLEELFFEYEKVLNQEGLFNHGATRNEFTDRMNSMLKKHTRLKVSDKYWVDRQSIIDKIEAIVGKGNGISKNAKTVHEIMSTHRDEEFQVAGSSLSSQERNSIKKAQEQESLDRINDKIKSGSLRKSLGDTKFNELIDLFKELDELQYKELSNYFIDEVNSVLSNVDPALRQDIYDYLTQHGEGIVNGVDESNSYVFELDEVINMLQDIASKDSNFKKWFDENFYEKSSVKFDKTGNPIISSTFEPIRSWYEVKPADSNYYENHMLYDLNGNGVFEVQGLPSFEFYTPGQIKSRYINERVVGETVDNRGNWLPLSKEQGQTNSDYINEKYYDLKENNPEIFKVLEKIKSHLLSYQDGIDNAGKVYYDLPRFQMGNYETLTTSPTTASGENFSLWQRLIRRIKQFWETTAFDAERGFNEDDLMQQVQLDMFDPSDRRIPIHGLYNIPIEETSVDFVQSMMKYLQSTEKYKALQGAKPLADAIEQIVNDPANMPNQSENHRRSNNKRGGLFSLRKNKKDRYIRGAMFNNFIEREFYGVKVKGVGSDSRIVQNAMGTLFGRASFSFFAFNLPSALKNAMNIRFNTMIDTLGRDDMDYVSSLKAEVWSNSTMAQLSTGELYQVGPQGLNSQISNLFDFAQGRSQDKFGKSMSRTFVRDIFDATWSQNFRRWLELQSSFKLSATMMYSKKIKRYAGTENEQLVSYMEAWELNDQGNIQLKEGFDPEWGITYDKNGLIVVGREFQNFKKYMHQKQNNLQGAYAEFDQPEAQRYLLFRMFSFLRRYFTPMLVNHYQFSGSVMERNARVNWTTGRAERGFTIEALSAIKHVVKGQGLSNLSQRQKTGFRKAGVESGMVILSLLLLRMLGWDESDPDNLKKAKKRTGAMPFPFTDTKADFNFQGFMQNHAIALLMKANNENREFTLTRIPYSMLDMSLDTNSLATSSTIGTLANSTQSIIDTVKGKESIYYTRDVGPYAWQKKGSHKFWGMALRPFGITGMDVDPSQGVQTLSLLDPTKKRR